MERIRAGIRRLGKDLYGLRYAFLGIAVYYLTAALLFGQFCPMMIFLHLPCPGCGMTRAFGLVLTGHWQEASAVGVWVDFARCFVWSKSVFAG